VYFLDVCGVVVYVGPLETDFCAGGGMREVAIVDSNHHPVFLRFFAEFTHRYENQLFLAEQNNSVIMGSNMKIMHASSKLIILDLYVFVVQIKYILIVSIILQSHLIAQMQQPYSLIHAQHAWRLIFLKVRIKSTKILSAYIICSSILIIFLICLRCQGACP
jgi:hypothetical protein